MSAEQVFAIANATALVGWILLAALPRWRWIADVLCARIVPALFAVLYVLLIAANLMRSEGGFSTLADVALLFSNPWLLLAGWVHYLAFDLFVGSWEVRDARERGVRHWLVVPCLALTFLFGPAGWLLYMGLRTAHGRRSAQRSR
jgi:ABA DEFICIENT 4-like